MNNEKNYDPYSGGSGKITLDFAALPIWWLNGSAKMPANLGVPYFGGWAVHDKEMTDTVSAAEVNPPMGFIQTDLKNSNGEAYTAWLTRTIAISPILRRGAWFIKKETGQPYSALNILAYLAEIDKQKKTFVPWGFCVLSGKAYSGQAIDNALATWRRVIQPELKKVDPNLPLSHLWMALGTFGNEIVTEVKGKGKKSPITPCFPSLPKEVTPEYVKGRLISEEIRAICEEAREASMEWAAAWNERKSDKVVEAEAEADAESHGGESDLGDIPF